MYLSIPIGTTSKIIQIPIYDSSSTTGAKLTGLVFNSAGLTGYYNREGAAGAATAITLATATKGTWATGGFIAIDATNIPGSYELHIPDAALASGAKSVLVSLKGATNMVPVDIVIELTATSNQDAVRGGMTALPNANAEAAGGLYTRGTGAGQIAQDANGNVRVNVDTIKTNPVVNGGTITFPTTATLASTTNITAATGVVLSGVTHTGAVIPTVTTLTGHTAQTGDNFARLGAPAGASIAADIAAVKVDTAATLADTGTDGVVVAAASKTGYSLTATTGLGNQTANITGNVSGSVGSVTGAVGSVTGLTAATVHSDLDDIQARLPAALTADGNMKSDILRINGDATAAAQLAKSAAVIISGAAITGTLSTTQMSTDLTEATNDHYKGRIIIWTSGVLLGQATDITAYNGTTKVLTYTAITEAPSNTDAFVIV